MSVNSNAASRRWPFRGVAGAGVGGGLGVESMLHLLWLCLSTVWQHAGRECSASLVSSVM